jgi:hypothetical protein
VIDICTKGIARRFLWANFHPNDISMWIYLRVYIKAKGAFVSQRGKEGNRGSFSDMDSFGKQATTLLTEPRNIFAWVKLIGGPNPIPLSRH